jgi:tetratricopeptide (TPR) repeat protein
MVSTLTAKALGQRIRQLRTRKGLTQQDLAGNDYSKSYISAIEQGKTRPSLEALQRMAARLEVPAGLLLDPEAPGFAPFDPEAMPRRVRRRRGTQGAYNGRDLDMGQIEFQLLEAELLIATGRPAGALDILHPLVPRPENGTAPTHLLEPAQQQKVYHLAAEASLRLEKPADSLGYLEQGIQLATQLSNRDAAERMRNLMGLAYYQMDQPLSALELHRACLEAVQTGVVRDPNFKMQVYSNMANDYLALHDSDRAASTYTSAAELFEDLDTFEQQAKVYWDLALAYRGNSNYIPARLYAARALSIQEALNNILLVAQMETNYGTALLRSGDLDAAEAYLNSSLELCRNLNMDCDMVLAINSLARASLERGDLKTAAQRAEQAMERARQALKDTEAGDEVGTNGAGAKRRLYLESLANARRVLAKALAIAGEVATAQNEPKKADKWFSEAIEIIEAADGNASSSEIYQRYAQVLAGRGQHEKASKYFERAYETLTRRNA